MGSCQRGRMINRTDITVVTAGRSSITWGKQRASPHGAQNHWLAIDEFPPKFNNYTRTLKGDSESPCPTVHKKSGVTPTLQKNTWDV
jgi:hypothetical protein